MDFYYIQFIILFFRCFWYNKNRKVNMRRIKLTISYNGTNYCGWQVQKNANTVQHEIENALHLLLGEHVSVIASGRTDSGVSARGQVAHFDTDNMTIKDTKFAQALNVRLPKDIRVLDSIEVDQSFHAQHSAKEKTYHYNFYLSDVEIPYYEKIASRFPSKVDASKLQEIADKFVGTHDFRAYCSSGSSVKDTIRTIYGIEILQCGDIYTMSITGNGFLYNMVRIIMGTIIDVAMGKKPIDVISQSFKDKDRSKLGKTAHANGLVLWQVKYNL